MENKQSRLFPWSKFGYNKLSSSSASSSLPENQQLLLDNHYQANGWTLDPETKSNREDHDNANLQRRIVALEREIVKLRAAMEETKSMAERASTQAAALEALVLELKSRLDSSPTTQLPLLDLCESVPDMGPLQNQVNKLQTTVNELKFNSLMNHNGQELERVVEKNRELEKKLTELTFSITHLKLHQEKRRQSSKENEEEEERREMLQQESQAIPESMESYLVVLIFMVSILIGAIM